MADNVTLNAGAGGSVLATDDIASVHYQIVKLADGTDQGTGLIGGDATNGLDVDVTRIIPGTTATALGKAEDAAHTTGDVGVLALGVRNDANAALAGTDLDYTPISVDSAGNPQVDVLTLPSVTIGTFPDNEPFNAAQWGGNAVLAGAGATGTGSPRVTAASDSPEVTALQIMDDWDNGASDGASVSGDVAHDGVDAGEPVKVGMVAIAHGANPTAVAAADRTNWYANRAGIPFVIGGHPNIVTLEAAYTAAQTDTAVVTIGASLKIVVTEIEALCDNANTVDVGVRVGFGAANTPTTTGVVLSHPGIAAGSGVVRGAGSGILGVGADGEDLRITCEVPTSGSIRVLVSYYTIES